MRRTSDAPPTTLAPGRAALATGAALVAFASNSLLCRAALRPGLIDAASFTAVRVFSGAATLGVLVLVSRRKLAGGTLGSALALFAYAAAFSFAYLRIGAGIGALLLFASVQVTMVGWAALHGATPRPLQMVGIAVALAGVAALGAPGSAAADVPGAALMLAAGAAWGAYSLRGRWARDPLSTTAQNFVYAVPLAAVLLGVTLRGAHVSTAGVVLAALSGAVASGLGYALWYWVVPALGATRAAAVQLVVPVLAGAGATVFLGERLTVRIAIAAVAIISGVALAARR